LLARVKWSKTDQDVKPMGRAHQNPILDTRVFEDEFIKGDTKAMTANEIAKNLLSLIESNWANGIAKNLFAPIDEQGHQLLLMHEIIDHQHGQDAASQVIAFIPSDSGQKRRKKTTKGWNLLLRWKDGSKM
jgi:hypothetical protein